MFMNNSVSFYKITSNFQKYDAYCCTYFRDEIHVYKMDNWFLQQFQLVYCSNMTNHQMCQDKKPHLKLNTSAEYHVAYTREKSLIRLVWHCRILICFFLHIRCWLNWLSEKLVTHNVLLGVQLLRPLVIIKNRTIFSVFTLSSVLIPAWLTLCSKKVKFK